MACNIKIWSEGWCKMHRILIDLNGLRKGKPKIHLYCNQISEFHAVLMFMFLFTNNCKLQNILTVLKLQMLYCAISYFKNVCSKSFKLILVIINLPFLQ